MANAGYLLLSRGYSARKEDIQWMKDFGYEEIIVVEWIQELLRPQGRRLLTLLHLGDEIPSRTSNAFGGIWELGAEVTTSGRSAGTRAVRASSAF